MTDITEIPIGDEQEQNSISDVCEDAAVLARIREEVKAALESYAEKITYGFLSGEDESNVVYAIAEAAIRGTLGKSGIARCNELGLSFD